MPSGFPLPLAHPLQLWINYSLPHPTRTTLTCLCKYPHSLPEWIPWGRYIVGGGRACGSCQSGCLKFLGPSDYLLLSWLGFYAVGSWGRGTSLVLEKGPPENSLFINEAKAFSCPLPPFSFFNKPKDGLGFFFFFNSPYLVPLVV